MGYYTQYSIAIKDDNQRLTEEETGKIFAEIEEMSIPLGFLVRGGYDGKWHEHEEEMREVSNKFTDVLFHLHGEGEDETDVWDKYFKNGKQQTCRAKLIPPPPFDETQLR